MGKIVELSEKIANLIAAGEVVERPLNVVKELVENSIDANSSYIFVHLTESGFKKIEVLDDGEGMDESDALCAFKRHATSKLKNEQELFRIHTLGFRGEAIPSIASVSEFILKTKRENEDGVEIIVKGSKFISKKTYAMNRGTQITVSNLFYNTPARLKYLKSTTIELAYIVDIMEKLALSHPNISFKLINNKEVLLQTVNSNKLEKTICDIYGISTFKNLLYFEETIENNINFKCYVSNSSLYKSKRNSITLIVNNRIVKNNFLISEIVNAYQGFIPISKYPVCIIYISIDPLLIDVNVSPSKTEIRFSNETEIADRLKELIIKQLKLSLYNKITDQNTTKENESRILKQINSSLDSLVVKENQEEYQVQDLFNEQLFDKSEKKEDNIKKIPYLEYIGQLLGTYLLFQNEEGLYLFDQHACEEKINYENLLNKLNNLSYNESIDLIIGFNIEFTKKDALLIQSNLSQLTNMGFVLEENIFPSFIVRSIPYWLKDYDIKDVIEEVIYLFLKNKEFNVAKYKDELVKMIACKKSIKANKSLSKEEVYTLIKRLNETENPFTCPHGRPSIIKLSTYEIEKLFKRVV